MLENKFWKPATCSTFKVCPIPFRLDTYRGCVFNCKYCFARDNIEFHRRKTGKTFIELEGNNAEKLEKWIERLNTKDLNYEKSEEVAFKERVPIKIGVMSDPFPYIEKQKHITYNILKVLDKYNYPVQISTKNPSILAEYYKEFKNPNWVIAVTIISSDNNLLKHIETNAPSLNQRVEGIKSLISQGAKVIVRIQPVIFPSILSELPELIKLIHTSGAFGFVMEGLKIRRTMQKSEQILMQEIGNYYNYDIRQWYKENGKIEGMDWIIKDDDKMKYINLAKELAKKYGLKCFVGDNNVCGQSCNGECCGTQVLRDYKILNNERTAIIEPINKNYALEFEKCKVNFIRSTNFKNKTIREIIDNK